MKLNLGCGMQQIEGFENVDCRVLPGAKVVDLNVRPWPWAENSIEQIVACDVLEHLYPLGKAEGQINIVYILKEIHRVLKPGGELFARIPSTEGRGAFQDPTHVTYWNPNTWWYFTWWSDLRPDDWPPFDVDMREEVGEETGIKWVLVKALKVGYDEVEVRKNAECTVDRDRESDGPLPENPLRPEASSGSAGGGQG